MKKLWDFKLGEYGEYIHDYYRDNSPRLSSEERINWQELPIPEEVARGMIMGIVATFKRVKAAHPITHEERCLHIHNGHGENTRCKEPRQKVGEDGFLRTPRKTVTNPQFCLNHRSDEGYELEYPEEEIERIGEEEDNQVISPIMSGLTEAQSREVYPDRIVMHCQNLKWVGFMNKGFICVSEGNPRDGGRTQRVFVYQHDFSWSIVTVTYNP